MITLGDLKTRANFELKLALDMAKGGYHNQYQSRTYPRLEVVKSGETRNSGHKTLYFVDGVECAELTDVIAMLNSAPHPMRAGLARHQSGED